MLKKMLMIAISMVCLLAFWAGVAVAQSPEGKEYIIQADDWLSKIAQKEYGNALVYQTIVDATNAKAAADTRFTAITDPNRIEVGQKLWLPAITPTTTITTTAVATASVTITATVVISYKPAEVPAEAQAGSCFASAIGLGRADAYRCMVDNSIYDPCFVIDAKSTVICGANPTTGEKGFVLTLTEPLPQPDTGQAARPWLIELAGGQVCGLMTGTVPGVGDRTAGYGCPDGTYLFNDFKRGEVWTAEQVTFDLGDNGFSVKESRLTPISRVWQ